MSQPPPRGFGSVLVEVEVPIAAPRERVWRALVEETGRWWPRDFLTGPAEQFVIQPRLGGLGYEDWGGGRGQVWYTVTGINPPERLQLLGHLAPEYGGPATSLLTLSLAESGGGTTLRVSDSVSGAIGPGPLPQTEAGWNTLFGCLRRFVEGG